MEKCVIYSRVSTLEQNESQISSLIEHSKKMGYDLVKTFDEKVSGLKKLDERKELTELLNYVKINKVQHILIWEISRLGRLTSEILTIIDKLIDEQVNIYVHKDHLNTLNTDKTRNNNTYLLLTILAGIGNNEVLTTRERTKRGLQVSREKGNFGGILPYGYDRIDKKLVVNPKESEIVKQIFEMFLNEIGTQKIANHLNELKTPTKYNKIFEKNKVINLRGFEKFSQDFQWTNGIVHSILSNPIYIGLKRFERGKKNTYKTLSFPEYQIIDKDIFERVESLMKSNSNKKGINTKHFNLLEGIKIKCGDCKRNYQIRRTKDLKDNIYLCYSKRQSTTKENCNSLSISIDKLNDSIWYFIRRSDNLTNMINKSIENSDIKKEIEKVNIKLERVNDEHKSIKRNEGKLVDLLLSDTISQDIYKSRFRPILDHRNKIESDILQLENRLQELKDFENSQLNLSTVLKNIKMDKHVMKEYLTQIVKDLTIYPLHKSPNLLSIHKQDKCILVELQLFSSLNPLQYVISQRSNNILSLFRGEYNPTKKEIVRTIEPERIKQIMYSVKG